MLTKKSISIKLILLQNEKISSTASSLTKLLIFFSFHYFSTGESKEYLN